MHVRMWARARRGSWTKGRGRALVSRPRRPPLFSFLLSSFSAAAACARGAVTPPLGGGGMSSVHVCAWAWARGCGWACRTLRGKARLLRGCGPDGEAHMQLEIDT